MAERSRKESYAKGHDIMIGDEETLLWSQEVPDSSPVIVIEDDTQIIDITREENEQMMRNLKLPAPCSTENISAVEIIDITREDNEPTTETQKLRSAFADDPTMPEFSKTSRLLFKSSPTSLIQESLPNIKSSLTSSTEATFSTFKLSPAYKIDETLWTSKSSPTYSTEETSPTMKNLPTYSIEKTLPTFKLVQKQLNDKSNPTFNTISVELPEKESSILLNTSKYSTGQKAQNWKLLSTSSTEPSEQIIEYAKNIYNNNNETHQTQSLEQDKNEIQLLARHIIERINKEIIQINVQEKDIGSVIEDSVKIDTNGMIAEKLFMDKALEKKSKKRTKMKQRKSKSKDINLSNATTNTTEQIDLRRNKCLVGFKIKGMSITENRYKNHIIKKHKQDKINISKKSDKRKENKKINRTKHVNFKKNIGLIGMKIQFETADEKHSALSEEPKANTSLKWGADNNLQNKLSRETNKIPKILPNETAELKESIQVKTCKNINKISLQEISESLHAVGTTIAIKDRNSQDESLQNHGQYKKNENDLNITGDQIQIHSRPTLSEVTIYNTVGTNNNSKVKSVTSSNIYVGSSASNLTENLAATSSKFSQQVNDDLIESVFDTSNNNLLSYIPMPKSKSFQQEMSKTTLAGKIKNESNANQPSINYKPIDMNSLFIPSCISISVINDVNVSSKLNSATGSQTKNNDLEDEYFPANSDSIDLTIEIPSQNGTQKSFPEDVSNNRSDKPLLEESIIKRGSKREPNIFYIRNEELDQRHLYNSSPEKNMIAKAAGVQIDENPKILNSHKKLESLKTIQDVENKYHEKISPSLETSNTSMTEILPIIRSIPKESDALINMALNTSTYSIDPQTTMSNEASANQILPIIMDPKSHELKTDRSSLVSIFFTNNKIKKKGKQTKIIKFPQKVSKQFKHRSRTNVGVNSHITDDFRNTPTSSATINYIQHVPLCSKHKSPCYYLDRPNRDKNNINPNRRQFMPHMQELRPSQNNIQNQRHESPLLDVREVYTQKHNSLNSDVTATKNSYEHLLDSIKRSCQVTQIDRSNVTPRACDVDSGYVRWLYDYVQPHPITPLNLRPYVPLELFNLPNGYSTSTDNSVRNSIKRPSPFETPIGRKGHSIKRSKVPRTKKTDKNNHVSTPQCNDTSNPTDPNKPFHVGKTT